MGTVQTNQHFIIKYKRATVTAIHAEWNDGQWQYRVQQHLVMVYSNHNKHNLNTNCDDIFINKYEFI